LEIAVFDEAGRIGEVVLGTEANDLDLVAVIASELLDIRRLAPARRSMR